MIELTKLNKKKFILNCELIETIESTPDTVITLRNGKLCIVKEDPFEVLDKVVAYKREIFSNFTSLTPPPVLREHVEEEEEEGEQA